MWAEMLQTGQSDRVPSHYRQLAINQGADPRRTTAKKDGVGVVGMEGRGCYCKLISTKMRMIEMAFQMRDLVAGLIDDLRHATAAKDIGQPFRPHASHRAGA
jgi:hypothetical protein